MSKPIEITRIFGHLDRDPMAVADVLTRLTPMEAEELLMMSKRWTAAVNNAYRARVEAGRVP
jgi:hypothetical protein